jgi:hypothetical protein
MKQPGWLPSVIGAAALPAVLFVLFWDGHMQKLPDKGAIGILIVWGSIQ